MNKILLMTDSYFPDAGANSVCLYEIAKVLMSRDYEVHILSINNSLEDKNYDHEGVKVYSVSQDGIYYFLKKEENKREKEKNVFALKFWRNVNKIRFLVETINYPVTLPGLARRYYKKLEELKSENEYCMYMSMFHPIHAVYAGVKLKEKYPDVKLAYYSLDSMTNDIEPFHFRQFKKKRNQEYEKKIHENANLILNLKCHEYHYQDSLFDLYRNKMRIVDIPLIKENKYVKTKHTKKISVIYSGTLYPIRNPEYACSCFAKIEDIEYTLDFYSRGTCEHILEKYQKSTNNRIKRNGYINRDTLLEFIANSDVLLSIGNENMEAIPSKIFEYISALKPIIHFYKSDNDSCLPYLEKYPIALMIKEGDEMELNIRKIKEFMKDNIGTTIRYTDISKEYMMNRPEYTVNILESYLKGDN